MSVSFLDKSQWKSVAKNAVLAGVSGFTVFWAASGYSLDKAALKGAVVAGAMALVKFVEKLLTPVQ